MNPFERARFWRGFAIGRQAFEMSARALPHIAGFIESLPALITPGRSGNDTP